MSPSIENAQEAYPLSWPAHWARTERPSRSAFGLHSMSRVTKLLRLELGRLKVAEDSVVISTNVELRLDGLPYANRRRPDDTGAAVYFSLGAESRVLACDKWNRVECNLYAIAKHIEALRAQSRWGVGSVEQAFTGYAALPQKAGGLAWHQVLGLWEEPATFAEARQAYRAACLEDHPDVGGSNEAFQILQSALRQAAEHFGEDENAGF